MTNGSLFFNGSDLNNLGQPEIRTTRNPDPAPPGIPERWLHTINLDLDFRTEMPATAMARLSELELIFSSKEGLLELINENGTALQLWVKVGQSNLAEAIQNRGGKFNVTLTGWTAIDQPLEAAASYQPHGSESLILFHNPSNHLQSINTERPDSRSSHRSLTTTTISFTARIYNPVPFTSPEQRMATLIAKKEDLENTTSREGRLRWSRYDEVVQLTGMTFKIDDSHDFITAEIQARYVSFPGDSDLETSLEIATSNQGCEEGETRLAVSGTVLADSLELATGKINSLITRYQDSNTHLISKRTTDRYLDGQDSDDDDGTWIGLNFNLEFLQGADLEFTYSVDQSEDAGGCRVVVSGEIKSSSESMAFAKSREFAESQEGILTKEQNTLQYAPACHESEEPEMVVVSEEEPELNGIYRYDLYLERWEKRERGEAGTLLYYLEYSAHTETIDLLKYIEGNPDELVATAQTLKKSLYPDQAVGWSINLTVTSVKSGRSRFSSLRFNHEFLCNSSKIRGTLQQVADTSPFTENTTSVSGTISGPDIAALTTFSRNLIPDNACLTQHEETISSAISNEDLQNQSLSFNYSWQRVKTESEIRWNESFTSKYETMTGTRTISGTAWAANKAAATTLISQLAATVAANPTEVTINSSFKNIESTEKENLGSVTFSYTWEEALTGVVGHDIIQANWSIERIGQINETSFLEPVCGDPVKQVDMGFNVGVMTASGSITARVQATAQAWGQGKRALAATAGGEAGQPLPPREANSVSYPKMNGTTATAHTFNFSYPFQYSFGLKGLWSGTAMT